MKKITWLIDKYLFDEYEERLITAIKKSGANYRFYDDVSPLSFSDSLCKFFTKDDIVIFHGSLQHGRQLSHLPIYPGIFMTIENYECFNYYGYFGSYLLNSDYRMMGLNDVLRQKYDIFDKGQSDEKVFIRPSNGYKTFPGQLLTFGSFEKDLTNLINSYGGVDNNTLVVTGKYQKIIDEYRFIVIDGEVVSGSQYFDRKNCGTYIPYYDKICTDKEVIDFAVKMLKIYQPDSAYTMDICRTIDNKIKLLELNSFNCASMYGNDYDKVVEAANKLAVKEYNELFEI